MKKSLITGGLIGLAALFSPLAFAAHDIEVSPASVANESARQTEQNARSAKVETAALSGKGTASDTIEIDANAATKPFPHFWENMFGSCRAVLSLRESYRKDLHLTKDITDIKYVRFHGIFHDDVGLYNEDEKGKPFYNFSYIDQVYDGLLANGVRPFVELSFMPNKLAAKDMPHAFWYKQNVSPPKDWPRWEDMIYSLAKHLNERYGEEEVEKWYFEVWNEPNLDFWGGEPKEETYYKLYDVTVRALRRANPKLIVGGPSTAQAAWVDRFIAHCVKENVPVDFVSTHVYANDKSTDILGIVENIPRSDMVARAVKKVHDQVLASKRPDLPIIWSEYNASYMNEVDVTDSAFMGPWLANNIRQCAGKVTEMSFWTFSDVFEEQGVVKRPFYGGYGIIAAGSIPKASYNAFKLLHDLGNEQIESKSDSLLVTRRKDGTIVIAAWNYAPPGQAGEKKTMAIKLKNSTAESARIRIVDAEHGSALSAWERMGKPDSPSRKQLQELFAASQTIKTLSLPLSQSELTLDLEPHALALIEI